MDVDLYARLGVLTTAPREVIDGAYRGLLQVHQPDHATDEEDRQHRERQCRQLGEAHVVLFDPAMRAAYDAGRRAGRADEGAAASADQPAFSPAADLGLRVEPDPTSADFVRDVLQQMRGASDATRRQAPVSARVSGEPEWAGLGSHSGGVRSGRGRRMPSGGGRSRSAAGLKFGRRSAPWATGRTARPRELLGAALIGAAGGLGQWAFRVVAPLHAALASAPVPVPWNPGPMAMTPGAAAAFMLGGAAAMGILTASWIAYASKRRGGVRRGIWIATGLWTFGLAAEPLAAVMVTGVVVAALAAAGWWLIEEFWFNEDWR